MAVWTLAGMLVATFAISLAAFVSRADDYNQLYKRMRASKVNVVQMADAGGSLVSSGAHIPSPTSPCTSAEVPVTSDSGAQVCIRQTMICGSSARSADEPCVVGGN